VPDSAEISYEIIDKQETVYGELNRNLFKGCSEDLFSLTSPVIIRDVRAVKFCFSPFRYNPDNGKITVTTHLIVDILFRNERSDLLQKAVENFNNLNYKVKSTKKSRVFESMYRKLFINYDPILSNTLKETGDFEWEKMIIITVPEYRAALEEYIVWKRTRGIEVELDISSAAEGAEAIKEKIQEKYDTDGITYIVLVGDNDDVPGPLYSDPPGYYSRTYVSDPTYALLEGNDSYGDALISRISCNNITELQIQLKKILIHEKGLFSQTDWIFHGVVMGTSEVGTLITDNIENAMLNHPDYFNSVVKIFSSDQDPTGAVKNAIEDFGANIIVYSGHGYDAGFGSIPFNIQDAANLKNYGGPFPMIHAAACNTGNFAFEDSDCFAEAMMKAGTVDRPVGAVAMLGASAGVGSEYTLAQREAFTNLYYAEEEQSFGALCYYASLYAMNRIPQDSADKLYRRWHLFGDCSTLIWKNTPAETKQNLPFKKDIYLYQNYPNPFNNSTTITYYVKRDSDVNLSVYDISGKLVKNLVSHYHTSGTYTVQWGGRNRNNNAVSSGVYFYCSKAGNDVVTMKIVYIK